GRQRALELAIRLVIVRDRAISGCDHPLDGPRLADADCGVPSGANAGQIASLGEEALPLLGGHGMDLCVAIAERPWLFPLSQGEGEYERSACYGWRIALGLLLSVAFVRYFGVALFAAEINRHNIVIVRLALFSFGWWIGGDVGTVAARLVLAGDFEEH